MASKPTPEPSTKLRLPPSVVTPADLGHLLLELEALEDSMLQLKMREGGTHITLPHLSKRLEKLIEVNKLNMLQLDDRKKLTQFLRDSKDHAPLMHLSFSSEATPAFLEKLLVWIRHEINPDILLTIGLQPAIGAGCTVRTTNKFFDLSLRQTFIEKRPLLLEQIIPAASPPVPVPVPATAAAAPTPAAPAAEVPAA